MPGRGRGRGRGISQCAVTAEAQNAAELLGSDLGFWGSGFTIPDLSLMDWPDSSGNGRDITLVSGTTPSRIVSGVGGAHFAVSVGAADTMLASVLVDMDIPLPFGIACLARVSPNVTETFPVKMAGAFKGGDISLRGWNGSIRARSNGGPDSGLSVWSDNTWHRFIVILSATTEDTAIFVDGADETTTQGASAFGTGGEIQIGGSSGGHGRDISEVLVWGNASISQAADIDNLLLNPLPPA